LFNFNKIQGANEVANEGDTKIFNFIKFCTFNNKLVRDEEIQNFLDTIQKYLTNVPSAKNFATWLNNCTIDE
jgi:hypothetical protein